MEGVYKRSELYLQDIYRAKWWPRVHKIEKYNFTIVEGRRRVAVRSRGARATAAFHDPPPLPQKLEKPRPRTRRISQFVPRFDTGLDVRPISRTARAPPAPPLPHVPSDSPPRTIVRSLKPFPPLHGRIPSRAPPPISTSRPRLAFRRKSVAARARELVLLVVENCTIERPPRGQRVLVQTVAIRVAVPFRETACPAHGQVPRNFVGGEGVLATRVVPALLEAEIS